jgi:hypothetical protein
MYVKQFDQMFDSSIAANWNVRHVFMDLLMLADSDGCVDMTYDAIVRRTNGPPATIVNAIKELMQPDPESRSPAQGGARIVPLDRHRNWGWRIVNYKHYRNLRTEEEKRTYWRDRQQQSRARRGKNVKNVNHVKNGQLESSNAEEEAEAVPSAGFQHVKDKADLITDVAEAKRLICEKILPGTHPGQLWSPDAEDRVARLCEQGLSKDEVDDIAWFKPFRREPHTPTKLMLYWTDEVNRACEARKKFGGGKIAAQKEEPRGWAEFFKWKHGEEVVLPKSFWHLPKDRQAEYERDFQTFEGAQKKGTHA